MHACLLQVSPTFSYWSVCSRRFATVTVIVCVVYVCTPVRTGDACLRHMPDCLALSCYFDVAYSMAYHIIPSSMYVYESSVRNFGITCTVTKNNMLM